jgi:hypothetical protein
VKTGYLLLVGSFVRSSSASHILEFSNTGRDIQKLCPDVLVPTILLRPFVPDACAESYDQRDDEEAAEDNYE